MLLSSGDSAKELRERKKKKNKCPGPPLRSPFPTLPTFLFFSSFLPSSPAALFVLAVSFQAAAGGSVSNVPGNGTDASRNRFASLQLPFSILFLLSLFAHHSFFPHFVFQRECVCFAFRPRCDTGGTTAPQIRTSQEYCLCWENLPVHQYREKKRSSRL